jgi:hypothetical protein
MKYYSFGETDEINIIGENPQISTTADSLFGSAFSTVRVNYGEIPDEIPFLELKFNESAKITDLLRTYNPYFGLIVSERLKKILQTFCLPSHKFYPVNVINENEIIPYYWFNFYDNASKYLDYKNSTIEIYHKFNFKTLSIVSIESENNLQEINSNLGFERNIKLRKVSFNNDFPNYDIFSNNVLGFGYNLISENLLKSLQQNNITGFMFSEPNYEIIFES